MKSEILQITATAYGGDAVARSSDGKICFVSGALPGETVRVLITAEKKRFNRAEVLEILQSSPDRIVPECPAYEQNQCPGCAYLHCTYSYELSCKQEQLSGFLIRKKLLDESGLLPPFAAPSRFGNRNKLVMHCVDGIRGYVGRDNSTVFPVPACSLARPELNELLGMQPPAYEREIFRYTGCDGAVRVNEYRKKYLTENLPGAGDFAVAPDGFFQTNIPVAAELVRRVTEEIVSSGSTELVELYCGVGVFSIAAAGKAGDLQCTGVEFSAAAVAAAKENARRHNVASRCRFYAGDAGKFLRKSVMRSPFTLVVDPPRSGLDDTVIRAIITQMPEKIIYISCAPDTLSRDLEKLCAAGFRIKSAGLLDMFPGTAHFETLTVLTRP
jgi:23S rRNA (uracil1939-C5)-methyltransferase